MSDINSGPVNNEFRLNHCNLNRIVLVNQSVFKYYIKASASYLLSKLAYSKPVLLVVANEGFLISGTEEKQQPLESA